MRLEGKTAIITGAGRGLGRATALAMSGEGAKVVLFSRSGAELRRVEKEIRKTGGLVLAVEGDVSKWDQAAAAIDRTVAQFAAIHILVNNAAVIGPAAFLSQASPEAWQETININLNGAYNFCRLCVPVMKNNNGGKIINIVSGLGRMPFPRFAAYAVSKSGLIQLTRSLAEELKTDHIQTYGIDPGMMDTDMQAEIRNLDPEIVGPELLRKFKAYKETGRLKDPREVARMMTVLAGPDTAHMSGKILGSSYYPQGQGLEKQAFNRKSTTTASAKKG
ncbi:MAG: SDR family NAD(P)-dependent oxidoreductase [Desulfosudaceae bacterium]